MLRSIIELTVDGNASRNPLLDVGRHARGLSVGGRVEVVVVDVKLRIRVGLLRRVEGNLHEVLTEDLGEYTVAERAILVKDLIDDVLFQSAAALEHSDAPQLS